MRLFLCMTPMLAAGLMQAGAQAVDFATESGFDGAVILDSSKIDDGFAVVTVKVPYLDVYGTPKEGLARLVVDEAKLNSGKTIPAFCHVHYEKDVEGAKHWARRGWAVFTAVYTDEKGKYPIDASVANGYNQARAIVQWARRLGFIDRTRLHIDGGSQGGYAALAVSADLFPVTATTADVPVVNWAYNLNYFEANKKVSKAPTANVDESPTPVLCSVSMLTDWCRKYFGNDLSSDAYYWMSPIACLNRITNPVLVTCFTGDMLVPMDQMMRKPLRTFDPSRFPEGFQRDFEKLTLCEKARKTFEECIPEGNRETFVLPLQKNSFEYTWEMFKDPSKKPKGPKGQEKPWSKTRQWSLLYCDEGGPVPEAPHSSFEWALSCDAFVSHYKKAKCTPELLNAVKLEWLMQRLERTVEGMPMLSNGQAANRFNFAAVERRDAITGLLDYARLGREYEARLKDLYGACPRKPLGTMMSCAELEKALAL